MKFYRLALLAVASYGVFICASETNNILNDLSQNDEAWLGLTEEPSKEVELPTEKNNDCKKENISIEKLRFDKEIAEMKSELTYYDKRNRWIVIGTLGFIGLCSTTYLLNKVIKIWIPSEE